MGFIDALKKITLGADEAPAPLLGRNDACWCGSGEKYKRCHLTDDERKRSSQRAAARPRARGRVF
jgi:hypothetical protein